MPLASFHSSLDALFAFNDSVQISYEQDKTDENQGIEKRIIVSSRSSIQIEHKKTADWFHFKWPVIGHTLTRCAEWMCGEKYIFENIYNII